MQHEIINIIAKLDNGSHSASQLEAVDRELLALFNKHAAQQSVQLTGGILPDLQALFDPEVLSGLKADITPPTSN